MGRLPSHIFVVRHGNRLDAADKQWHLTSPAPYDSPLTYGGFQQARAVGNHISGILEQAKLDAEISKNGAAVTGKRRRFKVVIHTSPFLRCIQTSIGISSGLAQTSSGSPFQPSDLIVPRSPPNAQQTQFKSTLLRLEPFLGEWLTPDYFDHITPPPGTALMIGSAKAELLRREDYSMYNDTPVAKAPQSPPSNSLWSGNSQTSTPSAESDRTFQTSPLASALTAASLETKKGYIPPRPLWAVSTSGKIPDGFVAHARDACTMIDYQWDSMRSPCDFGDGGKLGEEWHAMHQRFRRGLKRMLNWYATTDYPEELNPAIAKKDDMNNADNEEEEVETVVVIVSHGAGCNALMGAITHQPVLMDVSIASITMAVQKSGFDYAKALLASQVESSTTTTDSSTPLVNANEMYEIRVSATTEHLRSSTSTPVSSRSTSTANVWNVTSHSGRRGRTSTVGSNMGGPSLTPFVYRDPLSPPQNRSLADSPSTTSLLFSPESRSSPRGPGNNSDTQRSPGLWTPARSSLRFMDGGNDSPSDEFDSFLPDFDNKRFSQQPSSKPKDDNMDSAPIGRDTGTEPFPDTLPTLALFPSALPADPSPALPPSGAVLAAPIKLNTDLLSDRTPEEASQQEFGYGLWGAPLPPDDAELNRDTSHTKRRWTVNERTT